MPTQTRNSDLEPRVTEERGKGSYATIHTVSDIMAHSIQSSDAHLKFDCQDNRYYDASFSNLGISVEVGHEESQDQIPTNQPEVTLVSSPSVSSE